jgi:hypothetical protein
MAKFRETFNQDLGEKFYINACLIFYRFSNLNRDRINFKKRSLYYYYYIYNKCLYF